ncbi:MAG: adenine phosphoribosyltransferase [Bacteroidota bacterium]|nr:adenine phosphoribosyltransferase [Bacteroidota bacterium]
MINNNLEEISKAIVSVENFPKQGVIFRDITPILERDILRNNVLDLLIEQIPPNSVDKVVGVESRGFFFGILLAQKLGVGFVPVRKKGKLPRAVCSAVYNLEYGTDQLEIHSDSIRKGERILIHDDVLATGGTIKVVGDMVKKLGGNIVQYNFLIELENLDGRSKIDSESIYSLLKY